MKPQPFNPLAHQSGVNANGQSANRADLLAGLTRESQVKPQTGTATGDRAVQDAAKSQLYANQANMGRQIDQANAKSQLQQQQQAEALTQRGRQARMQGYQQKVSQSVSQQNLAYKMLEDQIALQNQWKTSLIGLLR